MGAADRVPSRKYHGLWISRCLSYENPRHILLDVIERQITRQSHSRALVDYDFGQGAGDEGRSLIRCFYYYPNPTWHYDLSSGELIRTFRWMQSHELGQCIEGIELRYDWKSNDSQLNLSFEPIFTLRGIHSLGFEHDRIDGIVKELEDISPKYSFNQIYVIPSLSHLVEFQANWYRNFYYIEERERGYSAFEDGFCPMRLFAILLPASSFALRFMMLGEKKQLANNLDSSRKINQIQVFSSGRFPRFYADLSHAMDQFVFQSNQSGETERVIAGYPWFCCWARDTLVSIPGLSLAWNNSERALALLQDWIAPIENELFGIRIANLGEDLNATGLDVPWLWCAALRFLVERHPRAVSRESESVMEFLSILERWILKIFDGECSTIKVTEFGIYCRSGARAVSWMDALIDGSAVTPRVGYPVEINALFFDAIDFLLKNHVKMKSSLFIFFENYLNNIKNNFSKNFWIADQHYIADGYDGIMQDQSLRPNQLWCLSADFQLFSENQISAAFDRVTEELLTPFGLRTLSCQDSRYQSKYTGDQLQRDRAYHQGTVWPWLIGKYTEAALKCRGLLQTKLLIEPVLANIERHFYQGGCLHQISEIFDGDAPHLPRGAPAQAWSVAEVLRSIWLLENARY